MALGQSAHAEPSTLEHTESPNALGRIDRAGGGKGAEFGGQVQFEDVLEGQTSADGDPLDLLAAFGIEPGALAG